jgi:hypothetical protein
MINISSRASVQTGDNVTINGFVIKGAAPRKILARATGPSLAFNHQPIPGRLMDPILELHNSNGALIFANDNWVTSPQRTQIQASGFAPKDNREPAIIANLHEGSYTTVVRGKNNTTGIALGEIFELPPANGTTLINLSARALVLTQANVLIDGFVVGGNTPQNILIRALGPELSKFHVSGELKNPSLDLFNANGVLLRRSDNWIDAPNRAQIQATGLAPKDNREPAILMLLAPNSYTAIVRGVSNTTGIALAEVYILN